MVVNQDDVAWSPWLQFMESICEAVVSLWIGVNCWWARGTGVEGCGIVDMLERELCVCIGGGRGIGRTINLISMFSLLWMLRL